MKIIKYCKKKYHFSNTPSIQIGTLNYYCKHDNEFIADPEEGRLGPYSIQPNKNTTLSRRFVDSMSFGCIRGTGIDVEAGATINF
jgi:hypothetical protein